MGILSFVNKNISLFIHRVNWRKLNRHNNTVAMRIFNRAKVSVGKYSYGHLNVFEWNIDGERLQIGNCVSLAEDVKFILGGNHSISGYSTFPFSAMSGLAPNIDAQCKGAIIVNDDVWIGIGAIILSGVTIGRGAVVAAGSIVSRDIPPYAIVAGNPAKVIKYRLSEDEIRIASKLDFSKVQIDLINEDNIHVLYEKPSNAGLDSIRRLYFDE